MATKIFVLFALLALSINTATAFGFPQCFPQSSPLGAANPCAQYYTQQTLIARILASSAAIVQQPLALLRQQCQTHLAIEAIMPFEQQQQQLLFQYCHIRPSLELGP